MNSLNSLLKFVYHPMVALSVGLHGLLLLTPVPSQPQPEPEAEPPETQVKLSSISSLKINSPPTPKITPPSPKPIPNPIVKAAMPPRPPVPNPIPTPVVSPSPTATPTPVATPSPVQTPIAAVTPLPSALPTAPLAQTQLQSSTLQGVGQASATQFYSFFPEPTAFFTAESLQQADANLTDPVPLEGITNMTRLENIGIEQAHNEILPQLYSGATFLQVGSYGGGDLYEVRQGNTVGYAVLVKEDSLGLATYVVEWNRNPQPPSQTAGAPDNATPTQ